MNVLLPAPGTPVIPMRRAFPVLGSNPCSTRCALSKSFGALLSIKVMALDRTTRSPLATPSMYCSTVIFLRSGTLRSGASGYSLAPVMLLAVVSMPRMTEQANSGFFSSGTQLGLKSSLLSGIVFTFPSLASLLAHLNFQHHARYATTSSHMNKNGCYLLYKIPTITFYKEWKPSLMK